MKKGIVFLLGLLLLGALAGCSQTQEDFPDAQKAQDGNEQVEQSPDAWGVTLLEEGALSDLPQDTLDSLADLNWLPREDG